MQFDTKIAVVLLEDLEVWQKANVTAFLVSGIAGTEPETIGEPYEDGSGNRYLAMFRQPVLVYAAADTAALSLVRERAVARGLLVAVYTDDMFKTGHDEANRAVVRAVAADDLVLAGLAVYGRRNDVDKALKGLPLHG